jgi:hypothetical protein
MAVAGVLVLTIAPLAFAAAVTPMFRVAPFTAVLLLLISGQLGEGPLQSAAYRLLEVAIGGTVAMIVSLLVFPERAHGLGLGAAARILDQLARVLPQLLAGFTRKIDVADAGRIQDETGRAVAGFQALAEEAKRERLISLAAQPDAGPLSRTLLRLRHDLVMIGRAGAAPLPALVAERLGPALARVGARASDYLCGCASALALRRLPPPLAPVQDALAGFMSGITALRKEGVTRTLSDSELEQMFALGFALEQLLDHFADLERCVREWARPAKSIATATPARGKKESDAP